METISKALTLLFILAIFAFSHVALVSCRKITKTKHGSNGFTLDLIHHDSPRSPFYNPSTTPSKRLQNAYQRSFARAASLFSNKNFDHLTRLRASHTGVQSDLFLISGEYLMKVSVGTPPVETFAIADTGSDLTWIQCKPCADCFNQSAPLFDFRKSSTYKIVKCHTKTCDAVGAFSCVRKNVCEYELTYGDRSHSFGDVATETFTFDGSTGHRKRSFPNIAFGCGHDNAGTFSSYTSGIVGLGFSNISIIQQLNKYIGTASNHFSYCLVPSTISTSSNATSHITIGNDIVSGPGVVRTPIIRKSANTYYWINLESVSVGEKKLAYKASKIRAFAGGGDKDDGNMIIDSGTTLTLIRSNFYQGFESSLVDSIKGYKRKEDPSGTFGLCYESKDGVVDAPNVVFHFTDADVKLSPTATFALVDEGLACLTVVPTDEVAIFGNLAQANYLIGYDLSGHHVSFLSTDCTKH